MTISSFNQISMKDYLLLKQQLEKAQQQYAQAEEKIRLLSTQGLSSQETDSSKKKRKAEQDPASKEAKKARTIANETLSSKNLPNASVNVDDPQLAALLQTITIEVPEEDGSHWQFNLPQTCFIEAFPKAYQKHLTPEIGSQEDKMTWVKKNSSCYHAKAIKHVIGFATRLLPKASVTYQYKKLSQREDIDVVKEIWQDVLEFAQTYDVSPLEKECIEFLAKRALLGSSCILEDSHLVCQSKHLRWAWRQAMFHTAWTAQQKQAISESLISVLKDDLTWPQLRLISEALVFLLTKEVAEGLSSDGLQKLSKALTLLDESTLVSLARLMANHPSAPPIFSLFALDHSSKGKEKLKEVKETLSGNAIPLLCASWHLANKEYDHSLCCLKELSKGDLSERERVKAYLLKAENYFALNLPQLALTAIDKILDKDIQAVKLKAAILFAMGELTKAADCLEKASLLDDDYMRIWKGCVKKEAAEKVLKDLQKADLENPFTLAGIATLYLDLNKNREALEILEKIIKKDSYQDLAIQMRDRLNGQAMETIPTPLPDRSLLDESQNKRVDDGFRQGIQITQNIIPFQVHPFNLQNGSVLSNRSSKIETISTTPVLVRSLLAESQNRLVNGGFKQGIQAAHNTTLYPTKRSRLYQWDLLLTRYEKCLQLNPQYKFSNTEREQLASILEEIVKGKYTGKMDTREDALARRGMIYRLRGDLKLALEDFNEVIEINSRNDFALANRGEVYRLTENFELALSDFNRAREINPENSLILSQISLINQLEDNLKSSFIDLNQPLEINSEDEDALTKRSEIYYSQGKLGLALADLNRLIKLNSQNASALAKRGEIYRLKQEFKHSLRDFNQALAINPQNDLALISRSKTYRSQKKWILAFQDLYQVLESYSEGGNRCADQVELYATLLRKQVFNFYRTALNKAYDRVIKGMAWRLANNNKKARRYFGEAIEQEPQNAIALAWIGDLYRLQKNDDKALAKLNEAIQISPRYDFALINRARVYKSQGFFELALKDLDQAIQINPQNMLALVVREKMQPQTN